MRSIFLYLKNATAAEVSAFLDSRILAELAGGTESAWFWHDVDESFGRYDDPDPEIRQAIVTALGAPPAVSARIDITGRKFAYEETTALARDILTRWDGIAMDDYSGDCWRLGELDHPNPAGRLFFRQ